MSLRDLQTQYTGNWVWRAVAALIDVKEIEPNPENLARKLEVSLEDVWAALEGLEKLGIIRRVPGGFEKILKYVYFSDRDLDPRTVLSDHVLISTQIHSRLDPAKASFYRTSFVATNNELAREFFTTLEQAMRKLLVDSAHNRVDALYALTVSGVDVVNSRLAGETK